MPLFVQEGSLFMWTAFMFYSSLHYLFTFRTCRPHFCSITLASNIQWTYKYPKERIFRGYQMIHGGRIFEEKIWYLLHNTSKDQRGLWGYRRQHHDTKWNIYSQRDHLIQSNICIYIRATNPTTLALFTVHLGRFLALVFPYFGQKWIRNWYLTTKISHIQLLS